MLEWCDMAEHSSADRLPLAQWAPRAQVVTRATLVPLPAVPCIDAHNHLGRWLAPDGGWLVDDVPASVAMLDAHHVATVVNLEGHGGEPSLSNLARYDHAYPCGFVTFCHLDWAASGAANPTLVPCA